MAKKKFFLLLVLGVVLVSIAVFWKPIPVFERIKGLCLVNPPYEISSEKLSEVKRVNAEWVAVIPYAFLRKENPVVIFDNGHQWWGERTEGTRSLISYAHDHGLKVMLKPHVWVRGDGWTGDFQPADDAGWRIWEDSYSRYLLHYARVADSLDVEMICIGTEFRLAARERPEFWRKLISEIRSTYSGKITYAANWDNFEAINWWDAVDLVGIDAYFPLTKELNPDQSAIEEGWKPVLNRLKHFSEVWKKPILFTEFGFQSARGAVGNHWEVNTDSINADFELQAIAYEATFKVLEPEEWYAGGFFWKWHLTERKWGRSRPTSWTPKNKPAEKVIAKWYANGR